LKPAVRRGDLAAVEALLAKGADWRVAHPGGESIVDYAESHGRAKLAAWLRDQGHS
jgi:hypothetical protein